MPTLQDGQEAIASGNFQQARLIFEAILQENPRSEDAWLGVADVLTDTEDKRICYDNVLKINKNNRKAKEGLRSLEPQANPLIEALQQTATREPEAFEMDMDDEGDAPLLDSTDDLRVSDGSETSGPPTLVLIALGLALSVFVFAIGGGTVYFLVDALVGQ